MTGAPATFFVSQKSAACQEVALLLSGPLMPTSRTVSAFSGPARALSKLSGTVFVFSGPAYALPKLSGTVSAFPGPARALSKLSGTVSAFSGPASSFPRPSGTIIVLFGPARALPRLSGTIIVFFGPDSSFPTGLNHTVRWWQSVAGCLSTLGPPALALPPLRGGPLPLQARVLTAPKQRRHLLTTVPRSKYFRSSLWSQS